MSSILEERLKRRNKHSRRLRFTRRVFPVLLAYGLFLIGLALVQFAGYSPERSAVAVGGIGFVLSAAVAMYAIDNYFEASREQREIQVERERLEARRSEIIQEIRDIDEIVSPPLESESDFGERRRPRQARRDAGGLNG